MNRRLISLFCLCALLLTATPSGATDSAGLFPLGRSWVGDHKLPKTYGLTLSAYRQESEYELERFRIIAQNADLTQVENISIRPKPDTVYLKADFWLLPFLNFFGVVGWTEGNTTVKQVPVIDSVSINYRGLVYGPGMTLALGIEPFFTTLTVSYTQAKLDPSTSTVETFAFRPQAGIHWRSWACYLGAMYIDTTEKHRGKVTIPFYGNVDFDVTMVEKEHWSYVGGIRYSFNDRWHLGLEVGFVNRESTMLMLEYRF